MLKQMAARAAYEMATFRVSFLKLTYRQESKSVQLPVRDDSLLKEDFMLNDNVSAESVHLQVGANKDVPNEETVDKLLMSTGPFSGKFAV